MANGIGVEEMRMTLARVAAYRKVCDHVRSGASSTMFTGALFLGFAYLNYSMIGRFHPILYGQILLGVGELLVGIWKKFRPSPPKPFRMKACFSRNFIKPLKRS